MTRCLRTGGLGSVGRGLAEPGSLGDGELRAVVQDKLELEWSPEQIAAHLRRAYPDRPTWHLCHETIYQALYRGVARRAEPEAYQPIADRAAAAQTPSSDPISAGPRYVMPHQRIEHRPAVVTERSRLGDWEGDLVVGPATRDTTPGAPQRRLKRESPRPRRMPTKTARTSSTRPTSSTASCARRRWPGDPGEVATS